jgi:hypothetical protein
MPRTTFSVANHGFKFQSDPYFWLDGGICLSALKNKQNNRRVPNQNDLLKIDSALWEELLTYQYKTILPVMDDIILWTNKTDAELMTLASNEYRKLLGNLDQQTPAIICLIRKKQNEEPMLNPFAVVYDYVASPSGRQKTFSVYDPFHPGNGNVRFSVDLNDNNTVKKIHGQSTGEPIRGFYVHAVHP